MSKLNLEPRGRELHEIIDPDTNAKRERKGGRNVAEQPAFGLHRIPFAQSDDRVGAAEYEHAQHAEVLAGLLVFKRIAHKVRNAFPLKRRVGEEDNNKAQRIHDKSAYGNKGHDPAAFFCDGIHNSPPFSVFDFYDWNMKIYGGLFEHLNGVENEKIPAVHRVKEQGGYCAHGKKGQERMDFHGEQSRYHDEHEQHELNYPPDQTIFLHQIRV